MMTAHSADVSLSSGDLLISSMSEQLNRLHGNLNDLQGAQKGLNENIGAMAEFLRDLNCHEESYDLQSSVNKIYDVKARVAATQNKLDELLDRLTKAQRQIAREVYKCKQQIKNPDHRLEPPNC